MKFFIKILKELKGEFTIKDLKLVLKKYKKEHFYFTNELKLEKVNNAIKTSLINLSKKEFDKWIIEYMEYHYTKNFYKYNACVYEFYMILIEKAKQNSLFVEFLDFTDIKEIEKNIIKFLNKFKGNYTKKFLVKEINKTMPYVLSYNSWYKEYVCQYEYKLEMQPFNLKKKEFRKWIIKQLNTYYKKNLFIRKEEFYIQFIKVFIHRIKFELLKKNLKKILKIFNKKSTLETLIKITYKCYPSFNHCFEILSNMFELQAEPKNLNKKEFEIWLLKQINYYWEHHFSDISYQGNLLEMEQFLLALRARILNNYKTKNIIKKIYKKNIYIKKNLNFLENNKYYNPLISNLYQFFDRHNLSVQNLELIKSMIENQKKI